MKMSSVHNNTFSSEKVISSESGEKSAQIKHCLQAKTALNKDVWILWEENKRSTFSLFYLWILDFGFKNYGLWTHILAISDGLM